MKQLYDITPPPELVKQWASELYGTTIASGGAAIYVATKAARWGADQELEACCEWLREFHQSKRPGGTENLRRSRRPKPPSLKEQALEQLRRVNAVLQFQATGGETSVIRRALEALDD
jgi:hypothetical protein